VEMPFKYIATISGEPILPMGMKELLRADLDNSLMDELF
jgi:Predicted SAM-dependent RNA methyltransferase